MNKTNEMPLSVANVRSLTLSRYYLSLAKEHSRRDREADSFVTINLLHEAIETFLVAASEKMNLPVKSRTDFSTYLDKIDAAIAPQRLPFRTMLNRLNKVRVQAKHDSIVPDRAEMPNFLASTESFLEEASATLFNVKFTSVSLIDLIDEGEVKAHLTEAQQALDNDRYVDTLIACRKALYLTFEKSFDISSFAKEEGPDYYFSAVLCTAPDYAKSKSYVEKNVMDPFDYIVIDHSRMDSELVKDGLDPVIYWNLWRLTPQVFKTKAGDWLVRNEPDKMAEDSAADHAPYVLENAVGLVLQRERKRRAIRTPNYTRWQLRVRTPNAKIYRKASLASDVIGVIPAGDEHVLVSVGTPDFDNREYFWRVFYIEQPAGNGYISGYVHQADLAFD